jgi:predicted RNA-binding protein with PUA-like domain
VATKKKTKTHSAKKKAAPKRAKTIAPRVPKDDGGGADEMDRSEATVAYEKGKWAAAFKRKEGERRYWLVKTEPDIFSFDDLLRRHGRTTCWDGVRNFAARNFLRDGMKMGDRVFFYHSMTDPQVIVGECEVAREGYVDHTAFDPKHRHYDPDSKQDNPQWYMVDLRAVAQYTKPVSLEQIKRRPTLAKMDLVRVGRLSVVPVTEAEYKAIRSMAGDVID